MADQVIPLTNAGQQSIKISLAVDGKTLRVQLTIHYSEIAGYWLMDIADSGGNSILVGIPLITGDWPAANILAQYGYLGIGSAYVINATQTARDYPDSTNLGSEFLLIWSDTAA